MKLREVCLINCGCYYIQNSFLTKAMHHYSFDDEATNMQAFVNSFEWYSVNDEEYLLLEEYVRRYRHNNDSTLVLLEKHRPDVDTVDATGKKIPTIAAILKKEKEDREKRIKDETQRREREAAKREEREMAKKKRQLEKLKKELGELDQ